MKRVLVGILLCVGAFVAVNGTVLLIAFPASRVRIRQIVDDSLITRNAKGFLLKTFIDSEGVAHKYSVYVPYQMQPEDRLPLLVFLNGLGKNGTDGIAPLYDGVAPAIWELKRNFPFVVVFPQCPQDDAWAAKSAATERAFAMIDEVEREHHTDPDRVYLTGLSSGGAGVWTFAMRAPDRFAAIVPVSSGPRERDAAQVIAPSHLPVWSFYVRGDGEGVISPCRKVHQALATAGGDSLSTELDGAAVPTANLHNAWDFAFRNPALYSWLLRQSRSQNAAQSELFHPMSLAALPELSKSKEWSINESGWLTCRTDKTASESPIRILEIHDSADIRFEIRPDGAERITILLASNLSHHGANGYRIDVSLDQAGGGGLFDRQSGDCLQTASPFAEACLRPGEWNDVQLVLSEDRLIVRLNQLTAIDWQGDLRLSQPLTLAWSASAGEVGWRLLRVKETTQSVAPSDSSISVRPPTQETPPFNHHIEDVISAWSKRQERVRHARFTWRENRRGDCRWTRFRSGVAPSGGERDTDFDRLVLTESWARHTAPWWYPRARMMADGEFDPGLSAAEFLRTIDKIMEHPPTLTPLAHRSVVLQNGRSEDLVTTETESRAILSCRADPFVDARRHQEDVAYRALLLLYRPFAEWGFNVAADRLRLRPVPAYVNGHWCLVVDESPPEEDTACRRVYCVDPERDFVIVRYAADDGQKLREQVDFEYDHTGTADWRPVRWTCLTPAAELELTPYPGMGALLDQAALEMVECDVNHGAAETPPPSSIKPGTVVFDECRNAWYEVGANDQQRPLTPEELASMFFEDSPLQSSPSGNSRYAVVCAIVGLAAWYVYLRRRRIARARSQASAAAHGEV